MTGPAIPWAAYLATVFTIDLPAGAWVGLVPRARMQPGRRLCEDSAVVATSGGAVSHRSYAIH